MTTIAHVQLLDANGAVLHNRSIIAGVFCDDIDGETAARTVSVRVRLETRPEPLLLGSPDAVAEYRQGYFGDVAEDQLRRGLTADGQWDPAVPRCHMPSPEGGSCSLRKHSDDQHERVADIMRPREVAEVWTDADEVGDAGTGHGAYEYHSGS